MKVGNHTNPCRRVTAMAYKYAEYPSDFYNDVLRTKKLETRRSTGHESSIKNVSLDTFYVTVNFEQKCYKEIVLTRQFDLQSLVGNAGGYVGICVGYSFLQLPQLIINTVSKLLSWKASK